MFCTLENFTHKISISMSRDWFIIEKYYFHYIFIFQPIRTKQTNKERKKKPLSTKEIYIGNRNWWNVFLINLRKTVLNHSEWLKISTLLHVQVWIKKKLQEMIEFSIFQMLRLRVFTVVWKSLKEILFLTIQPNRNVRLLYHREFLAIPRKESLRK